MDNVNIQKIDGYTVRLVAHGVYAIDEFGTDLIYLVLGQKRAMLVDTGAGFGHLSGVVEKLTKLPVFVVNTHGHADHALGNYEFEEVYLDEKDFRLISADYMTQERYRNFCIKTMKEPGYYGPDVSDALVHFQKKPQPLLDGMQFDLGERVFEAIEISGHTPGGMVFLDRKNRILICGDSIVSTPILIFDEYSTTVCEYLEDMKKLLKRADEFDILLPGHYLCPIGKIYLYDLIACAENIVSGKAQPEFIDMSHMSKEKTVIYKKGLASIIYNEDHIGQ